MSDLNCPYKVIALRLHDVNWLDRRWILQRLPVTSRQRIAAELRSLRQLKIGNALELYEQLKLRHLAKDAGNRTAFARHLQSTLSGDTNLTPVTLHWLKQSKLLRAGDE